ncbi:2224_t:CDS:10, partial [Entrophospora sp. SA101]
TSSNEIVLLDFVLNSNQVGKLKSSPRYKINLFCCSAEQNLQNIQNESLVEFPDSCEVRVNHKMSPYSRSDAQPPRDITDLCKVTSAHVNQVHFGFAATSKKYLIIVLLIKTILVEEIVDKIKNGKYIEKEAVLEKIKKQIQDSDVVATSSIISLKDPLGQCRISIPPKTTEDQETIVIDSNGNWSECKKAYKLHDIDESDDTFNKHSPNKKRKIENNIFIVDSSDGEGEENNCAISETIDESQDIAHLNNVVEKYQFTIDKITRELDQLQLEMYNDSTLYNNNIEDLQISEEEDDNEGKINQEDSIDDVVVLENIVEKDEEERQEIVSTTSIIMSTKDDNDSNDGDDLMDLTNNLNESTNTRCFYTKPPRYRPYNIALNEIRRHQRTTNLLLRRIPFSRVVEEIATNIFQQHSNMGFEFESTAITALQEAAETYLIELFQDARLCTIHAKRATLSKEDIELVLNIR